MTPIFRQRQSRGDNQGNNQNNNQNNRRRRRPGNDGLPKGDNQADLENLPELDFSHFDSMAPAELLKLAKKHKVSAELLKFEVI